MPQAVVRERVAMAVSCFAESVADHCVVVTIFEFYMIHIPDRTGNFYFRPLPDDGSGVPKFARQVVGRNRLSNIIPDMCKAAGIEGRKTGHSVPHLSIPTKLWRSVN